jgi:poly(3-hydroxybutyrate) depolymerase
MSGIARMDLEIDSGPARLEGTLTLPEGANALVVFAHGSGSSRHSPRNRTHLFEEPGALERVAELAASWFRTHLRPLRQQDAAHADSH